MRSSNVLLREPTLTKSISIVLLSWTAKQLLVLLFFMIKALSSWLVLEINVDYTTVQVVEVQALNGLHKALDKKFQGYSGERFYHRTEKMTEVFLLRMTKLEETVQLRIIEHAKPREFSILKPEDFMNTTSQIKILFCPSANFYYGRQFTIYTHTHILGESNSRYLSGQFLYQTTAPTS